LNWINNPCPQRDEQLAALATERQTQLTKPLGSLGELENIAIRIADIQQTDSPSVEHIAIAIFAADHGVVEEGVSAFPQEVTAQMVMNFLQGGAAISVLAKQLDASLEVIDVGILNPLPEQNGLIIQRAGSGTTNSAKQAAMTKEQLESAFQTGYDAVERAVENGAELFIGGEMGIGNTTSAAALYCALLGLTPAQATGAGTGLDDKGIKHKVGVIKQMLELHQACGDDALEWLRCIGGFEIVALTGAYIRAAQCGLPVIVDGFISTAAALCATLIQPKVNDILFFSHISAEQGHRNVMEILQQKPLLDLSMRLGEGSGAAVAANLLRSACLLHTQMATFAEAAVATQTDP